jgi:exopolysaccharide biosynthesis polyprenyl glycosylphosphotransferase
MTIVGEALVRPRPDLLHKVEAAPAQPLSWPQAQTSLLVAADLLAGAVAGVAARGLSVGATAVMIMWLVTLACFRSYATRPLDLGWDDVRHTFRAAITLAALAAFAADVLRLHVARTDVAVAIPVAAALSLAARGALLRTMHVLRARGRCMRRVVAIGHSGSVADIVARTNSDPKLGLVVVAACVLGTPTVPSLGLKQLTVTDDTNDIPHMLRSLHANMVVVAACPELAGTALRQLSWQLAELRAELVLAPGLVEIATPRIRVSPANGLPLLHVQRPHFSGGWRALKHTLDRALAALALVIIGPLMLTIGFVVRLTSPGPAIFRQTRVGRDGTAFTMFKFRSMVAGAEDDRGQLTGLSDVDGPLFKMREDPRVTAFGRVLRRLSLDELPQLLNVVAGQMSLVGPRPPLPGEVEQYNDTARRRLLVKPGITGLWQVSGRSTLSWEESVGLDLRYVENWTFSLDLLILWRTLFAVLRRTGAY